MIYLLYGIGIVALMSAMIILWLVREMNKMDPGPRFLGWTNDGKNEWTHPPKETK